MTAAAPPVRAPRTSAGGWIALLVVYVVWGSTYLGIRIGVGSIPPFVLAGTRYAIAGALLCVFGGRSRQGARSLRSWTFWRSALVIGLLLLVGGNGLVTFGEQTVPSGIASLLVATVPFWMALFDAILRRRPIPGLVLAGVVIGLAGTALLVSPSASAGPPSVGSALVLLAAVCWAAGSLYSQRAPQAPDALLGSGMEMLAGGVLLLLAAAFSGQIHPFPPAAGGLLALAWLTVFGSLVGFSAYGYALKALPASTVSTYAFANPIVAVLLGWGLLGETI
ncbi:MAG: EamA family transporter, partial [Chloroflexota bacterium]|nr:EamA family transporter [Chloroflexota bacterium]